MPLDAHGNSRNLRMSMTPGFCVICGDRNKKQLCEPCRLRFSNAGGTLHPAVRYLQQEQDTRSKTAIRNLKRIRECPIPKPARKPQYQRAWGVRFVSLDRLTALNAAGLPSGRDGMLVRYMLE